MRVTNKRHKYEDNFRRGKHITKHAPLLDRILEARKLEHHNYGQTGHNKNNTPVCVVRKFREKTNAEKESTANLVEREKMRRFIRILCYAW